MHRHTFLTGVIELLPRCFLALACIAALMAASSATAQSVYRPLGLQPGDEYRLLFVTEGKRNALSTNIADYNVFVTSQANSPNSVVRGLTVQWFAIASTSDVDAIDNTDTNPSPPGDTGVPIYLVDGASRFANHYDNVWDPDSIGGLYLLSAPNLTQNGVTPSNSINNVWTGTDYYGVAGGFGGPIGTSNPSIGASIATNSRWINNSFFRPASEARSFYAISSILVAVPEPPAGALVSTAIAALVARRRGIFAIRKSRIQAS